MSQSLDPKELLRAVDRALPNIKSYLCEVLKQEKLSLEAEALRARYEAMLLSLEKVSRNAETLPPGLMRHSVGGVSNVQLRSHQNGSNVRRRTDGDQTYFSHGCMDGLEVIPEQPKTVPELAGFLLWEDDHHRWHRRHCRLVPREKKITIHESAEDNKPINNISLEGASLIINPPECDKELCFTIEEVQKRISILGDSESSLPLTKHSFAAYSEGDFSKWQSVLEHVISESRPSSQWIDSLFSSSARDSMFSGGSGDRLDEREVQFLDHESDEDNLSDCTIYEDIDELVQQFDATMQATAQAMNQMSQMSPKKKKKKKNQKHQKNQSLKQI